MALVTQLVDGLELRDNARRGRRCQHGGLGLRAGQDLSGCLLVRAGVEPGRATPSAPRAATEPLARASDLVGWRRGCHRHVYVFRR